jgi:hypothetical protein
MKKYKYDLDLSNLIESESHIILPDLPKIKNKIPSCLGYQIGNPIDGYDWDCFYERASNCEDCLCNYYNTGGDINPITGKKVKLKYDRL